MKRYSSYLLLFLIINFGGLALGSLLMNNGPMTDWYLNLNKAPWTPPGWVFGAAWTTIMICFSVYLTSLFIENYQKKKLILYGIQVVFNISWNYLFFNKHQVLFALIVIILLTILIFYFFLVYFKEQKKRSYLLLPYMIWLCIATSLNLYILIYN
ncbi:MAG: Tryptophan-rich protein TspO [Flavobacterium sp. SCGC AAA160-P02]|nr:MAG: Tryptophan-rich protein TspO [Flavobacterium sp. SCGC AAA160-P02]